MSISVEYTQEIREITKYKMERIGKGNSKLSLMTSNSYVTSRKKMKCINDKDWTGFYLHM